MGALRPVQLVLTVTAGKVRLHASDECVLGVVVNLTDEQVAEIERFRAAHEGQRVTIDVLTGAAVPYRTEWVNGDDGEVHQHP